MRPAGKCFDLVEGLHRLEACKRSEKLLFRPTWYRRASTERRLLALEINDVSAVSSADSDEAGRLFQGEAGHLFRFHSGQCSELKPDTLLV